MFTMPSYSSYMSDKPLRPATREEVTNTLGYALRFGRSGKTHRHASDDMARIAADVLAEHAVGRADMRTGGIGPAFRAVGEVGLDVRLVGGIGA